MAQPVEVGPDPALAFESQPGLVVAPSRRRRRRWGRLIALVCLTLVAGGLLAVGSWLLWSLRPVPQLDSRAFKTDNFQLLLPGDGWQRSEEIERKMRLNLALRRSNPSGVAGLAFKDYRHRNPSDAELFDEAMKRLRPYFTGLNYQEPFETPIKDRPSLGGEPAAVMDFVGTRDEVDYRGQVYLLAHRGFAYWFFTWGPEQDRELLLDQFETVREGFSLTNNREGWQPRPRDTETFVSEKLSYQLTFVTDVWQRADQPQDYDPHCELALRGFEPIEDEETGKKKVVEYAGKLATILVLVLPKAADLKEAHDAALAHILKRKQEENARASLEPVNNQKGKPEQDRDAGVGGLRGRVSRLRITGEGGYERFGLVGVVHQPEGVLVVFCESAWSRRDFWDQEFRALMDSVRSSGKAKPREKPKKAEKPKTPDADSTER
jgi:hypothetical protein